MARHSSVVAFGLLVLLGGCAHRQPPPPAPPPAPSPAPSPPPAPPEQPSTETARRGATEKGIASWYGEPYHGRQTASGEVYDMYRLTAAHRTLPFGTVVRVTRRDTGDRVEVRINDRGPFIAGRIIDLSYAAAQAVGLDVDGVAPVQVEVVGRKKPPERPPPARREAHPADDCWWVQLGAFSSFDKARRIEQGLEADGEPAVAMEAPGGLHRVRVGPFDRRKPADRALDRLRRDWPEAVVVPCG
jgi:rare lipoprotein A